MKQLKRLLKNAENWNFSASAADFRLFSQSKLAKESRIFACGIFAEIATALKIAPLKSWRSDASSDMHYVLIDQEKMPKSSKLNISDQFFPSFTKNKKSLCPDYKKTIFALFNGMQMRPVRNCAKMPAPSSQPCLASKMIKVDPPSWHIKTRSFQLKIYAKSMLFRRVELSYFCNHFYILKLHGRSSI